MLQKVIKVGNSAAITIPKIILQETGLEIGDSVEVTGIKKPIKVEIIPRRTKVLREDQELLNRLRARLMSL